MSTLVDAAAFVTTGDAGLDHVLHGGMQRGAAYLVQGDPGAGKTTLALQYVQAQLRRGEPCLYVTLTESRRDLENTCRSHGWAIESLELLDLTPPGALLEPGQQTSVFHPADTELSEIMSAV